jgi:hypothetical protein
MFQRSVVILLLLGLNFGAVTGAKRLCFRSKPELRGAVKKYLAGGAQKKKIVQKYGVSLFMLLLLFALRQSTVS